MTASKTPAAGTDPRARPRVRARIFETACDLFYQQGIRAVGVDAIASGAGTNKMSFYRNFPSKDDLVAEYLRDHVRSYWENWDRILARHPEDPRQQVIDLFEHFVARNRSDTSRGCALGNAAVEIREPDHPAHAVIVEYKNETRHRWQALAKAMGVRRYQELGDALMLLQEGGYQSRLIFRGRQGPLHNAAHAARALIKAYLDC